MDGRLAKVVKFRWGDSEMAVCVAIGASIIIRGRSQIAPHVTGRGEGVNRRKLSSVPQSQPAKYERDVSPKYTEIKRTVVKNSVTHRNSRKIVRGEGVNPSRKKSA